MLSVSGAMSGAGQGGYYVGMGSEDYYLEGGEPPGEWFGQASLTLGLVGQLNPEEFRNLLLGFSPDGRTPWVQNAGDPQRQSGWDLTFSAPKSVSVLWSQASPEVRLEIQQAHAEAVKAALTYLESVAGITRRGKDGALLEQAGFIAALFEHGTSRAQDPQLHTHGLVLNLTCRRDGTTGTIRSIDIFRHKMAAGAIYRAELAAQLTRRLGLQIVRERDFFEIAGVSPRLIEEFSKRRAEVMRLLAQRGLNSAVAAKMAVLETREAKQCIPRAELFRRWQEVGRELGWSLTEAAQLLRKPVDLVVTLADRWSVAQEALMRIMSQHSHFPARDLVRRSAEAAQGRGLGAEDVLLAAGEMLRHSQTVTLLQPVKGERAYSTAEMLALEQRLLNQVDAGRRQSAQSIAPSTVDAAMPGLAHLSPEQKSAVEHITTQSGNIAVVSGLAGTGKSTMLAAARELWEADGLNVIGAALAGKAARGLEESSGIPSQTISRLLRSLSRDGTASTEPEGVLPDARSDQAAKSAARSLDKSRETPRVNLNPKTILVVDEAGMVATRQMMDLVDAVTRAGAKLVLVGDARQLQPIEAGGPFAAIGATLGQAELTNIVRQRQVWAREAVRQFSEGQSKEALTAYADRGLVSLSPTRDEAKEALIRGWSAEGVAQPEHNLILTGDNAEVRELNRVAQEQRIAQGRLGQDFVRIGTEYFHEHDRVLFTRNSGFFRVTNGNLGTVTEVTPETLVARLDCGRVVRIPIRHYDDIRLGYAVTTHKAQGMTAQNAFILAGGAMQDRELSYVQASRTRGETRFYTDQINAGSNLAELIRAMGTSHQKDLAVRYQHENPRPDPEPVRARGPAPGIRLADRPA